MCAVARPRKQPRESLRTIRDSSTLRHKRAKIRIRHGAGNDGAAERASEQSRLSSALLYCEQLFVCLLVCSERRLSWLHKSGDEDSDATLQQ